MPESWPRQESVDKLATEVRRLREKGVRVPFVYVDLKQFIPSWMRDEPARDVRDDQITHQAGTARI